MINLRLIDGLIFSVCCLLITPRGSFAGVGTQGAQFLKIPPTARSASLGSTAALSDGSESIFQNPAGLASVERIDVRMSQVSWIESINYSNLAAAVSNSAGTFGIGINYLSVPEIIKYDNTGSAPGGSYAPSDTAVTFGYARAFSDKLRAGINIKYLSSRLDDVNATALAADAGIQLNFGGDYGLKMGLAVQNAGTEMKFVNEGDPMPFNIRLGASYLLNLSDDLNSEWNRFFDLDHNVMFIAEANYLNDSEISGNFGMEYKRIYQNSSAFALRAGYLTNIRGLDNTGLTLGLGIAYSNFVIDYAFVPYGELGNTQRVTVGLRL